MTLAADWLYIRREPDGSFVFVCGRCGATAPANARELLDPVRRWVGRATAFRDAHRHEGEPCPS